MIWEQFSRSEIDLPMLEQSYKDALRLQPEMAGALFHLGVVYLQEKKLDDAASEPVRRSG